MRRRTLIAVSVAFCIGFIAASATSHGYAKLNVWRARGDAFQLGYIVGFLDATTLFKYRDPRGKLVPAGGRPDYELWRSKVNEFFADPKNEKRLVVDAMDVIGAEMSRARLKAYNERNAPRSSPSSPRPSP